MWVYIGKSKRKCFSSSTFIVSQRWHILSSHRVIGKIQPPVSLCNSWEFILILAMWIFFFALVKIEREFWSSRLGLMTSLQYLYFILSSKFSSHQNFCLNFKVIIFLISSIFCKITFSPIPHIFNHDMAC